MQSNLFCVLKSIFILYRKVSQAFSLLFRNIKKAVRKENSLFLSNKKESIRYTYTQGVFQTKDLNSIQKTRQTESDWFVFENTKEKKTVKTKRIISFLFFGHFCELCKRFFEKQKISFVYRKDRFVLTQNTEGLNRIHSEPQEKIHFLVSHFSFQKTNEKKIRFIFAFKSGMEMEGITI